jgi:uncharacterized membrane protein YqhA
MRALQRWIESAFETFLFNARLIVILAVLGSLTSSVLMFVRGAILIIHSTKDFFHQWKNPHGEELSIALISSVDSFLFATVLLIFAMGIYELFISKIDPASRNADSRPNWLQIHSLDDLKGAVGKVILMILIVRLFESAVKMKYENPLHLLYLGLAVLFVAASLYLQHLGHKHDKPHATTHYSHEKRAEEPPGFTHGTVGINGDHVSAHVSVPPPRPSYAAHAATAAAQHPPAPHASNPPPGYPPFNNYAAPPGPPPGFGVGLGMSGMTGMTPPGPGVPALAQPYPPQPQPQLQPQGPPPPQQGMPGMPAYSAHPQQPPPMNMPPWASSGNTGNGPPRRGT